MAEFPTRKIAKLLLEGGDCSEQRQLPGDARAHLEERPCGVSGRGVREGEPAQDLQGCRRDHRGVLQAFQRQGGALLGAGRAAGEHDSQSLRPRREARFRRVRRREARDPGAGARRARGQGGGDARDHGDAVLPSRHLRAPCWKRCRSPFGRLHGTKCVQGACWPFSRSSRAPACPARSAGFPPSTRSA